MKRISKHIINLILIGYFLMAGLGFNVVNYCCNSCEEHGIVEVAQNSCGNIHHTKSNCCSASEHQHAEEHTVDMACGKLSHHPDSCHLLRIQVETPTSITKIALKEYQKILLLAIPILNVRLAKIHSTQPLNDIAYSPPNTTHATGRKILTNKSVLII